MKYLIVGSGGTGGPVGGFLARAGHDVSFIARGNHLASMKQKGLTIHSKKEGSFTIFPCKAFTMEEYHDTPDVIFVCVKYYSLEETADFIRRIASPSTLVIPILNVFGTGQILQEMCPNCTVMDGCIYIVGMLQAPGVIEQPADIFKVYFGYRKAQPKRLIDLALQTEKDLNAAHIQGYLTEHIEADALQKFSYVSPIGAAGIYYNGTAGDFMVPGEKQDTFISLIKEITALGTAMGINLPNDLVRQNLHILNSLEKTATTSMQRDLQRGTLSEIDGLVHRIVRLSKSFDLTLPTYEKISNWALSKGLK